MNNPSIPVCMMSQLRLYFFIAAQIVQAAWFIWIALPGQPGQQWIQPVEVTDGRVVRAGVSVTWSELSWSGGHEFELRSGQTWGCVVLLSCRTRTKNTNHLFITSSLLLCTFSKVPFALVIGGAWSDKLLHCQGSGYLSIIVLWYRGTVQKKVYTGELCRKRWHRGTV